MPRFLLVVTLIVVVASTIVTTGAFVPLACRSCREYKQQQRIDAAVEKSSSSSNSRFGVTAAVAGRRAGMSMQLKPSSGTAPPFTTKEEQENDKGIKVSPTAWKWPKAWPYNADYFSRKQEDSVPLNGPSNLSPIYDEKAVAALQEHYLRFLPPSATILEIGASAHSYLPPSIVPPARLVGIGVNEEEMNANPSLTERVIQDLNADPSLPPSLESDSFDAVLIANTMEFLVQPREVLREAWRVLKPGGYLIISFASKNRINEERQIKIWGTMNDDQRIWIVGSFIYFACSDGFTQLKGYDLSEGDSKGMMAGLSGKTPLHIIQAVKSEVPTEGTGEEQVAARMKAALWTASSMGAEDKALALARMFQVWKEASTEDAKEEVLLAVSYLPRIYDVLQEMGNAIPLQLKALLATRVATHFHGTEEELGQLRQGLGLTEPSAEFWAPLGKMTGMMNAEDKVLLLAECVPMHAGTAAEKQALSELIPVLEKVIAIVKAKCPDLNKTDAQLLAVDLCMTDFVHVSEAEERGSFVEWVEGLNEVDLKGYLQERQSFKGEAVVPGERGLAKAMVEKVKESAEI